MPDVWDLADMRVDEVARLFAASGAEWTEPARRGPVRRLSVTDPTV
jgi:hypothetical protein